MKTIEENIEAAKLYISEAAKAELWEEGRQMERHELLRWRDPKDENPTERGGLCIAKFITGEYEIVRYRDGRYMGLRPHYDNPRQVIVNGISVTSYDLRTADYTDVVMGWRPIKEEDGEEQKQRSIKTLKKTMGGVSKGT